MLDQSAMRVIEIVYEEMSDFKYIKMFYEDVCKWMWEEYNCLYSKVVPVLYKSRYRELNFYKGKCKEENFSVMFS